MWLSRILIFIIFFILLNLIRSFLGKVLKPASRATRSGSRGRPKARRTISGQMIKDPHCGMYVAEDLAVTLRLEGQTFHFCSEECRDTFDKARAT